jgi:formate hydrogenlyase subunit 3/multisubunit Na+/H+ antiporter MnhD subunit
MLIPYVLLQTIVVPLVMAPVLALVGRRVGKRMGWIVAAVLSYTTILLLLTGLALWNGAGRVEEEYVWSTVVFSLKFGFKADGLSLPVALIMNLVCAASAVYSVRYMERKIEQLYGKENKGMYAVYYSVYLLFAIGLTGVALSTNLIELYVFVELALIPSYFMIDLFGYEERHRVGIMYFIWNHIGAALFLVGIVLAFSGNGGSFDITALSAVSGSSLGFWVCLLILLGWLIKMGTFGFHVWLPHAYSEYPSSVAAISAVVGLSGYVIVRLLFVQMYDSFQVFSLPLMILALVTMVYGALLTIAQDDINRLYACSTISQTAYTLLGIASLTSFGVAGGIFLFLSQTVGKCILFAIAGILIAQTALRDIRQMRGLARKLPLTATLCILGSMVLSGVPPLSGFQAEWIMFVGVFQEGQALNWNLAIAIIGIFTIVLTSVYTFWPMIRIFFGQVPEQLKNVKEAPLSMTLPLFVLALVSLLMGIFPDLIMRFLHSLF